MARETTPQSRGEEHTTGAEPRSPGPRRGGPGGVRAAILRTGETLCDIGRALAGFGGRLRREPALRRRTVKAALGIAAVLALLWVVGTVAGPWVERFARWVAGLGPAAPLVFIAGYVVATVALFPAWILTVASGVAFGLWLGALYSFLGAAAGAAIAFVLGRYIARGLVERRIAGSPKFAAMDRAIGREGLKITTLLRLSPVFPYNLLNYALGLTGVRFVHYNLASFAMIPATFLYVYIGVLAGDVVTKELDAPGGWQEFMVKAVGFVATVAVTVVVTRVARRTLKEETGGELATDDGTAAGADDAPGAAGEPPEAKHRAPGDGAAPEGR